MKTNTGVLPSRIHSLDTLRGIAALSVVLWHWQHFFYSANKPGVYEIERQPFYDSLSMFYRHGSLAVELFFCISGFVFFWLYSRKISSGNISPAKFFIDRFSRLYPLHIITFLIVAALQLYYIKINQSYFIYQLNDIYHALLNIFLIPSWGFENGYSFNGPIWSVSIEAMLYCVFFVICIRNSSIIFLTSCLIGFGLFIYPDSHKIGIGFLAFFCGGAAFIALEKAIKIFGRRIAAITSIVIAFAALSYLILSTQINILILTGLIFPTLITALISIELLIPKLFTRTTFIGDLSYSSYLIHFPLQIVFAIVFDHFGFNRSIFYSLWMLPLFMAILIPLSFASHRLFEVPAQRAIRSAFRKRAEKKMLAAQ